MQSKTLTIARPGLPGDGRGCDRDGEAVRGRFTRTCARRSSATADQVSADGHTAMVEFDMRGKQDVAEKRIDPITTATGKIAGRHPGFFVGEAGSISSGKALNDAFNQQLAKAGERSVPLTLIVLLLVFGALVAAGLPLLLALSAVIATLGLDRDPEPPRADGSERQRGRAARRACRRRRLLALLPEARARGAGRRQEHAGRARGCRRHLRPVGAHLGPDRDGRDGRDAVLAATRRTSRSGSRR